MTTAADDRIRTIRCPGCGGPSLYAPQNAWRPFCSARCRNGDFGAWASGQYAVGADPDPDLEPPGGTDLTSNG